MELVREKIRSTLPSLEEGQLETCITQLIALGVKEPDDCTYLTEADLDGILPKIQSRRLIQAFSSGIPQTVVSDNLETPRRNTSSNIQEKKHSHESDGTTANHANYIKKTMSSEMKGASDESMPTFKLHLDKTWQNSKENCRRFTFGKNSVKQNKTIMMIGATGAGKTTLINTMINYIMGVRWEDDFRFILIDEGKQKSQAESQTSAITAYQINHMNGFQIPCSLTIVDTPGFGDTRGISQDKEITKQIHEFFTQRSGIDQIDAVCFVVQASLARLSSTQKYIFDSILSIFGKDIAGNILMLLTFADPNRPAVLEAIKVSQIPCSTDEYGEPLHFKFNNSPLIISQAKKDDLGNFNQMYWNLGISSLTQFFISLEQMNTQSLTLTQEVLKERQQLETLLDGLEPQVKASLTKLDEIKQIKSALMQHKGQMNANKDFNCVVQINVPKMVKNKNSTQSTNCQTCKYTCHKRCRIPKGKSKNKCSAMKKNKCTVCPGKCASDVHIRQPYKWEYKTERKTVTSDEIKKKYDIAHGHVMSNEQFFKKLQNELEEVQDILFELIQKSQKSVARLNEIALKPQTNLSTFDYIDLLIKSEEQEGETGYEDRIESLMEVKKRAEILNKVARGEMLDDWRAVEKAKPSNRSFNATVLFSSVMDSVGAKIGLLKK